MYFQKIFLKRKLKLTHWLGMTVTMVGLILVGCSSIFKTQHKSSSGETILGKYHTFIVSYYDPSLTNVTHHSASSYMHQESFVRNLPVFFYS